MAPQSSARRPMVRVNSVPLLVTPPDKIRRTFTPALDGRPSHDKQLAPGAAAVMHAGGTDGKMKHTDGGRHKRPAAGIVSAPAASLAAKTVCPESKGVAKVDTNLLVESQPALQPPEPTQMLPGPVKPTISSSTPASHASPPAVKAEIRTGKGKGSGIAPAASEQSAAAAAHAAVMVKAELTESATAAGGAAAPAVAVPSPEANSIAQPAAKHAAKKSAPRPPSHVPTTPRYAKVEGPPNRQDLDGDRGQAAIDALNRANTTSQFTPSSAARVPAAMAAPDASSVGDDALEPMDMDEPNPSECPPDFVPMEGHDDEVLDELESALDRELEGGGTGPVASAVPASAAPPSIPSAIPEKENQEPVAAPVKAEPEPEEKGGTGTSSRRDKTPAQKAAHARFMRFSRSFDRVLHELVMNGAWVV